MKNDGALNKRNEMKQKLPTILTKLSKQVKRTTHAIIVAILYLGYRLSFAVDATASTTIAAASAASRRAISLCHSLNVIVYVPFNYDYNVYEQNNQNKKNAHAHTFSMFV